MALSVVTITQLNSTIQRQLNKADNGVATVLTQLVITRNNISQKLFQFDTKINNLISLQLQNTDMEQQANCGPGLWYQVAHLNMSDPSQKCPSVWREYNRVRACGRTFAATGSCATKRYLISNQYSRVCGRVIGYQFRSPDAFHQFANTQINFDGINITKEFNIVIFGAMLLVIHKNINQIVLVLLRVQSVLHSLMLVITIIAIQVK